MCVSPTYKVNPYYGSTDFRHALVHDVEHQYIACPCGHCPECRAVRQSNFIQRVETESKYNHIFFATLTYDNKHLPTLSVEISDTSVQDHQKSIHLKEDYTQRFFSLFKDDGSVNERALIGYSTPEPVTQSMSDYESVNSEDAVYSPEGRTKFIDIAYADISHLQLLFKRMRDNNRLGRSFRYLAVTERGSERGRPHIHILFFIPKHDEDSVATCESLNQILKDMLLQYWATNVGTRKNPIYERNFTFRQRWINRKLYRNFDCHYVNPNLTTDGVENVAFYVTKYLFKESKRENALRSMLKLNISDVSYFNSIWNVVKSRCVFSKGLGLDSCFFTNVTPVFVSVPVPVKSEPRIETLPDGSHRTVIDINFRNKSVLTYRRSRVLVPNPSVIDDLRMHVLDDKEKGFAVFVNSTGKHIPLGRYYRERILTDEQRVDLYYSWNAEKYPEKRVDDISPDELRSIYTRYEKSVDLCDSNEVVDSYAYDIEEYGQDIDPYSEYRSVAKYYNLHNYS